MTNPILIKYIARKLKSLSTVHFSPSWWVKNKSWDNTLSRFLPTSFYIKFIDEISSKYMSIILSTDGFYRPHFLWRNYCIIDLTVAEIEAKLNEFYFGSLNYPSLSIISGETQLNFKSQWLHALSQLIYSEVALVFPSIFLEIWYVSPFWIFLT